MSEPLRALIVEDRVSDAKLVVRELERAGFAPTWKRVETEEQYLTQLEASPEVILADYTMPRFGAMRALEVLQTKGLDIPFIIVSGSIGEDIAVEAMRHGAADYLLKDRLARLGPAVNNALEQSRSRKENKRAETKLHSTHEQLRQLLAHSPVVIYSLKIEGERVTPTVVSDNIERLLGVRVEEATHEWWLESLHPNDRERVLHKVNESLTGDGYSMEYQLRHKDGSYHWIEDNNRVVRDALGKATKSFGVWTDITERKAAEKAIRESEARLRSVLDSALDGVIIMDCQGRVVEFNPAAEKTFGYKRDGAVGQLLADLIIPPALRERHHQGLARYLSTGAARVLGKRIELTGMRSDHSEFPVELAIIRMGSQEPPMFTGFIRDITERKQAEGRLREQAKLLDLAHDAIMVRDLEDRVEYWNCGAELLYGWTAEEVQGKQASTFLHADPPATTLAARVRVTESGEWSGDCKHLRKGGGVVVVHSRWTLVRDELGKPKSVLIINTDITEHKKLEMQLIRAQRLESIGTLASGVAHDLNNILAPILMCSEMLAENIPGRDSAALVSLIEESARRGAGIVRQVLTFARGVEGERVLINATHLILEITDIAQRTFPKTIQITGRYPQDLWSIKADPTQLHQVLLNLSVNARDAMPNGGTIEIDAENFEVDENYASMTPGAHAGPHVILRVKDTGSGMSRDVIDKIFDPFFTTKEVGKGTGLGLSTVLGIVKSHGGFISVHSELGSGTTFKIFLPADRSAGIVHQAEMSFESLNGNGELILVVDDEPGIVRIAQMILESHNYRVLCAKDGPEALVAIAQEKEPISAVLSDISMPYMDGVALIRAIKKMKPDMRFIASTGQEETRASELNSLAVFTLLMKPYDKQGLLTAVRDALNGANGDAV